MSASARDERGKCDKEVPFVAEESAAADQFWTHAEQVREAFDFVVGS